MQNTGSIQLMPLQSPIQRQPPDSPELAKRKPWKHIGYREAAKWMSLDRDFFVLRRFSELNARLILSREVRIAELERQLEEVDDPEKQPIDIHNGTILRDPNMRRVEILETLWPMMKDYSKNIALPSPP
jgi:hypothetical protein